VGTFSVLKKKYGYGPREDQVYHRFWKPIIDLMRQLKVGQEEHTTACLPTNNTGSFTYIQLQE
jgi:hypothetical protein